MITGKRIYRSRDPPRHQISRPSFQIIRFRKNIPRSPVNNVKYHRANHECIDVVRALAKRLRDLVKHQAVIRDDDVQSGKGQQGFGLVVHWCPLFCLLSWRLVAVVLCPLDHVPGIERCPGLVPVLRISLFFKQRIDVAEPAPSMRRCSVAH